MMLSYRSLSALGVLGWFGAGCSFGVALRDNREPADSASVVVVEVPDIVRDDDTADDTDTQVEPCEIVIADLLPAEDSAAAYYRDPIAATLSQEDPSATILVRTTSGEVVPTTLSPDPERPLRVRATPDAPLTPGAEYRATVTACDGRGSRTWAFTVGSAGLPLECDPTGLSGLMGLADARWVRPEGVGELLRAVGPGDPVVGVTFAVGGTLQSRLSWATDAGQPSACLPTTELPPAVLSGPDLAVSVGSLSVDYAGHEVILEDASLSGTIAPDCSAVVGGRLSGRLDLRTAAAALADTVPELSNTAALCALVAESDTPCEPCADGELACVGIVVEGIDTPATTAVPECVDAVACHPSCSENAPECVDPSEGECG